MNPFLKKDLSFFGIPMRTLYRKPGYPRLGRSNKPKAFNLESIYGNFRFSKTKTHKATTAYPYLLIRVLIDNIQSVGFLHAGSVVTSVPHSPPLAKGDSGGFSIPHVPKIFSSKAKPSISHHL